jgi:hypothetical protein
MAHDPERKAVRPIWIWPLVGLAILVAAWVIFAPAERADTAPIRESAIQAIRGTPQNPYTEVTVVGRPENLEGQHVQFSAMTVERGAGPNAFWATKQGARLLVILEGAAGPGDTGDRAQAYSKGDTVSVTGTIQRFPGYEEASSRWNLRGNRRDFRNLDSYIAASQTGRTGEMGAETGATEAETHTGEPTGGAPGQPTGQTGRTGQPGAAGGAGQNR